MADLEQQIDEWRRRMLAAGIETPVPMEELECHLRDEVDQLMESGLSPEQAFEEAIQRIGQADVLENEFGKLGSTIIHERVYSVLLGALALHAVVASCMLGWLSTVSTTSGPLSLPYAPDWSLPWQAALTGAYATAIVFTLLLRHHRPEVGRRMTRALNWALIPMIPIGSLVGFYGHWKVDKDSRMHTTPANG
jgi:hypothetical protein